MRHCLAALLVLAVVATTVVTLGSQTDSAGAALDAARRVEVVDGNLQRAIEQYQAIVSRYGKSDRAVAAQALLRMAECYGKLGNAEAQKIYARIVSDYPDQTGAVTSARAQLAVSVSDRVQSSGSLVCSDCVGPGDNGGALSPDGQWLGYSDVGQNLMARNLFTGEVTRIVTVPTDPAIRFRYRAKGPAWSPDSSEVAYSFVDAEIPGPATVRVQLRVTSSRPGGETDILVDNPDFRYVTADAWSPDGKSILVQMMRRDFTWQLGWVSRSTGAITVLRSLDWQFNEFRNGPSLSPDGRYITYATFTATQQKPGRAPIPRDGGPGRLIHILAADGTGTDYVLPVSAMGFTSPKWTPDGARILYTSGRDGSEQQDLWGIDVRDGRAAGTPFLIKASIGADVKLLGHTASGFLCYLQPESRHRGIVVADLSAKDPEIVTTPAFAGHTPRWSADGTSLAWLNSASATGGSAAPPPTMSLLAHSFETGRRQVFGLTAVPFPFTLLWNRSGSAVFALQGRGRELHFAQVDVATAEQRLVGRYRPVGDAWHIDALTRAPDDSSVLLTMASWNSAEARRPAVLPIEAIDLATGSQTQTFPRVPPVRHLSEGLRAVVGFEQLIEPVLDTRSHIELSPDGRSIAFAVMRDGASYVATRNLDGTGYREVYGPVAGRQWEGEAASRLSDPVWLLNGRGIAVGVLQDDFSWRLLRITEDGQAEPLGGGSPGASSLARGTLGFEISPDGRRVASERLMLFNSEVWLLDVASLVRKP